jgi:outer membrane protein W
MKKSNLILSLAISTLAVLLPSQAQAEHTAKVFLGTTFSEKIDDIEGKHVNADDDYESMTSNGSDDISPNLSFGLSHQYYFNNLIGVVSSFEYSKLEVNKFTANLDDSSGDFYESVSQPKFDIENYRLRVGPSVRWKGNGNNTDFVPYFSPGVVYSFGEVTKSDWNRGNDALYGKTGKSSFDGFGYDIKLGVDYEPKNKHNLSYGIEYSYVNSDVAVDDFRSFDKGADLNVSYSQIMFSIGKKF